MLLRCFRLSMCLCVGLLLALPTAAAAAAPQVQQIHKCRVDGVATFQRHVCAEGQAEQVWEVDVVPVEHRHAARIEAIRRELQARKRALEAQRAPPLWQRQRHRSPRATEHRGTTPAVRARAPPGAVISLHHQPRACERARHQRERAYRKAGLKRSLALSRRMDDRVFDACR